MDKESIQHFQGTTKCHHLASSEGSARFRLAQIVFYQDMKNLVVGHILTRYYLVCLHLLLHLLLVISLFVINHLVDYQKNLIMAFLSS